ncbi:hypothetical protein EDF56_104581 [Novosphingobium sp. PhB165]|uniref:hypothetical protein n=1 Tax=Novosphingobium sp. PhB165 TaxID=2485105 RepID=UPI001053A049|nr:hypothetical protein [Novosphingobium sp. PhB165]TCM19044.1 hypothetical protein EDF56_104581 [Novosphingobium sp. PhB165]
MRIVDLIGTFDRILADAESNGTNVIELRIRNAHWAEIGEYMDNSDEYDVSEWLTMHYRGVPIGFSDLKDNEMVVSVYGDGAVSAE